MKLNAMLTRISKFLVVLVLAFGFSNSTQAATFNSQEKKTPLISDNVLIMVSDIFVSGVTIVELTRRQIISTDSTVTNDHTPDDPSHRAIPTAMYYMAPSLQLYPTERVKPLENDVVLRCEVPFSQAY